MKDMKNFCFSVHCYINIEITVIVFSVFPPPVLYDFYLSCFKISRLAPYSWKSGRAGIRWLESGAYKAVFFCEVFSHSLILTLSILGDRTT